MTVHSGCVGTATAGEVEFRRAERGCGVSARGGWLLDKMRVMQESLAAGRRLADC